MNLQNILTEIEKVDPEIYERTSDRRNVFKNFGTIGKRIALTALPFTLGSVLKKAYGQTPTDIIGVLNFALTLEYLEASFYTQGVTSTAVVGSASAAAITALSVIRDHENAHVNFLKTAITSAGGTPVPSPSFDFSAKGNFTDTFSNYDTFLAVAQTFEDTGVRAYKGQAGNVKSNRTVLTAALNIHSVEARHASHIRQMRMARGGTPTTVKPWITLNQSGIGSAAVQASYNGEDNLTQAGVGIVNINGQNISREAASESFDEPLTKEQVLAIVQPFLA